MSSIRFAHISDLHLGDPGSWPWRWLVGKRLLGYLSWRRRRRHEHRTEILERLRRRLVEAEDETLLVTGDLGQIGLPVEFEAGRRFLESLGPPERVLLVPGNHDSYGPAPLAATYELWRPYLGGLKLESAGPRLDRRGDAVFIGLDSARPTAPFLATGRIGRAQLAALDEILAGLAGQGLFRVLHLHHPPEPQALKWRKRLDDGAALLELLDRRGIDLVVHGHDHRPRFAELELGGRRVPVIGVASASALGRGGVERRAAIHRFRVDRDGDHWQVALEILRHDPELLAFESVGRRCWRLSVA